MAAINENTPATQIACIRHISPSRAAALLSCKLAEAFRSGDCTTRLPSHPKTHFGILVHEFLSGAGRGRFRGMNGIEIRKKWDDCVRIYENNLLADQVEYAAAPLSTTCDDYEVNVIRTLKIAASMSGGSAKQSPLTFTPTQKIETEISSTDGIIVGRPDRYSWENGSLTITDIKTGKTIDHAGKLNYGGLLQLQLYAYLLHERYARWPDSLKILTLRGEEIEVPFNPVDVERLVGEIKNHLSDANESINEVIQGRRSITTLATPSPEACRFCRFRPNCLSYWMERQRTPELAWPRDVSGRIEVSKIMSRDIFLIELHGLNNVKYIIRGVAGAKAVLFSVGNEVSIYDLYSERALGVFSWRPISSIFPALS